MLGRILCGITSVLLLVLLQVAQIHAHSFVMCTDFRYPADGSIPPMSTSSSLCKGYPRRFFFYEQQGDGYTYRPKGSLPCDPVKQFRASDIVSAYTTKYPMATYKKGRDVCLQWPARNHALGFNGPYLPSGNIEIYVSAQPDGDFDPSQTEFNLNRVKVSSFSDCSVDNPNWSAGQNSNDRPCRGCFTVPSTVPDGTYTFQWWWEFNPGEYYATCWDAQISSTGDSYSAASFKTRPVEADNPQKSNPPDFIKKVTPPVADSPVFVTGGTPAPTTKPTTKPTTGPTSAPTTSPTSAPTTKPTTGPTTGPTTAPTTAPTVPGKLTWQFKVVNSWPGGFQAELVVTTPINLNGWVISFKLPNVGISNLWNGNLSPTSSNPYYVTNPSGWNTVFSAGQKITLGMVCTGSSSVTPTAVTLYSGSTIPAPTTAPTTKPTSAPTSSPTSSPTTAPTSSPTTAPTTKPTSGPTTAPTPAPTLPPSGSACSGSLKFESKHGRLYVNNLGFDLKGINWFGFESAIAVPHGCWTFSSPSACYSYIFGFLQQNNFNAIRVPLALQNIDQNPTISSYPFPSSKFLTVLGDFIDQAAKYGLLIMLDLHILRAGESIPELWYDGTYTNSKINSLIDVLVSNYGTKWNVFALDIKNEPHGVASWGKGNPSTDWNTAATNFGNHALSKGVNWLIFIEGITGNTDGASTSYSPYWGENLMGVIKHPITLSDQTRLVYSPHAYGPSVAAQSYHNDPNFPKNLEAIWDEHFGFVKSQTGQAVVPGEWGGFYTDKDKQYQDQFASYLIARGMSSNFYWALNPNSGDTGGILNNDWRTPNSGKIQLLQRLVPSPTAFSKSGNTVCIKAAPTKTNSVGNPQADVADDLIASSYTVSYGVSWQSRIPDDAPQTSGFFGAWLNFTTTKAINSWSIVIRLPSEQLITSVGSPAILDSQSPGQIVIRNQDATSGVLGSSETVSVYLTGSFEQYNLVPIAFAVTTDQDQSSSPNTVLFEANEATPDTPPSSAASTTSLGLLSVAATLAVVLLASIL